MLFFSLLQAFFVITSETLIQPDDPRITQFLATQYDTNSMPSPKELDPNMFQKFNLKPNGTNSVEQNQ